MKFKKKILGILGIVSLLCSISNNVNCATATTKQTKENLPVYKISMVGASGSGKTTILKRLLLDKWCESTQVTIGVDFQAFDCKSFKTIVWDTAGIERCMPIDAAYIRHTDVCAFIYDITLFHNTADDQIEKWLNFINDNFEGNHVIVVPSKIDLIDCDSIYAQVLLKDRLTKHPLYDTLLEKNIAINVIDGISARTGEGFSILKAYLQI